MGNSPDYIKTLFRDLLSLDKALNCVHVKNRPGLEQIRLEYLIQKIISEDNVLLTLLASH